MPAVPPAVLPVVPAVESVGESLGGSAGGSADGYVDGVPTFDFVRDRIEGRYATAVGSTELAQESVEGRSVAQQQEDRDAKARERLEQIRRRLRTDTD